MPERKTGPDNARLDRVVAEARRATASRHSRSIPGYVGAVAATSLTPTCSCWKSIIATTTTTITPPMAATGSYCAHTVTRMSTSGSLPSKAGIQSCLARADRRRLRTNHSPT